jgi:CBS domain-containing protein
MTVERILKQKGRDVATISPFKSILEAAQSLAVHRIGALVVTDQEHRVLGILSERDIIRALSSGGATALNDKVQLHMTARVKTCTSVTSVNEVMEIMTEGKFRHLPVVEDGTLIGIVSIGDVVKKRIADVEGEQKALKEYISMA